MAASAAQYSQLSDFSGNGGQYQQPYPYNNPAYAGDQYPSASLPQAQVQNFIQSPPVPSGGRSVNQPRFGQRTVARTGGRRRKQQTPPGPIVAKDGAKPVVPLYSYQTLKNNTVVQVPIFWTALNIALGYQVQGDQVIRGLPCIKRLRQLFCTNAGSQYPMALIESFINENKALTRRMFGAFPPPPPDFASEVSLAPEIEPFETVDFVTESFPLDQGFPEDNLAPLEVTEPPLPEIPIGGRGRRRDRGRGGVGREELVRVGRDRGSAAGRDGSGGRGRDPGRDTGRRGRGAARGAAKSSGGGGVETVVETPPVGRSTENPPRGGGAARRAVKDGRQNDAAAADLGEFWETGESGEFALDRTGEFALERTGEFGLEREETEENFVNVDVKSAAPAAGAAGGSSNDTNSTSSTSSKNIDLTGPSSLASENFTNSVQTSTEPDLPLFFDETGPSGEIGMEAAGYMESTISGGRRRGAGAGAGGGRPFDRQQDFVEDRRAPPGRRGFADQRRKPRRRGGAPRGEISRRLTDTLADTGPSAWSARSARARPRHLRHSFPAEPRPPANQVPTPDDVKPTEPTIVAQATTAKPVAPIKAGVPYVALKVKGCRVLAPSVNRHENHKLPVTPVPTPGATGHPPQQQFPRAKRSVDSMNNNLTTAAVPPAASRQRRQAVPDPPVIDKGSKHLVDSCESKVEIVTPYWAANSAGEIRAIVNTKHFPQAIHQEICKGTTTSHCTGNCLCEQKYTYHRLLSYDPQNNCKGIFIDWFLFPSCCACRCPP